MKYIKKFENNTLTNNNIKTYYNIIKDHIKEVIPSILNNDQSKIIDEKTGRYTIQFYIERKDMTEIVELIDIELNKVNKTIEMNLYKEDDMLPEEINVTIRYIKSILDDNITLLNNWKYVLNYNICTISEIYNIKHKLTKENYEIHLAIHKFNI